MTTAIKDNTTAMSASQGRNSPERADLDTLKDDFRDIGRDLGRLKTDAIDASAGVATSAMDSVRAGAETAMDGAKRAQTEISTWVADRPFTSLLIAVGVGAIVARLISRR